LKKIQAAKAPVTEETDKKERLNGYDRDIFDDGECDNLRHSHIHEMISRIPQDEKIRPSVPKKCKSIRKLCKNVTAFVQKASGKPSKV
jgi:hypothetical protein